MASHQVIKEFKKEAMGVGEALYELADLDDTPQHLKGLFHIAACFLVMGYGGYDASKTAQDEMRRYRELLKAEEKPSLITLV